MENKVLPKYLARPDDHVLFSLNEDGQTYSSHEAKMVFPNHLHHEYDYNVVNSYGFYEVTEADFPELEKKRKEYSAFMVWHNRSDGHGGIKGGTIEEFRQINKNNERVSTKI